MCGTCTTQAWQHELIVRASRARQDVIRMHCRGTNVASAMSVVDILVTLYFRVMHIPSPDDARRDRLILSKGHAAAALYAVLAQKGFVERGALEKFLADGSELTGHPPRRGVPGVEVATGSLGHGLAIATGLGWAAKQDGAGWRCFVVMGDGELQEGSVWEAAVHAAALRLDNVAVIVDANGLQGYGRVDDLMPRVTLAGRWRAFGWEAREVDGHNHAALVAVLEEEWPAGRPLAVIAHTIKGKGVAEMEDQLGWHYYNVPAEKREAFLAELEQGR